MKTVERGVVVKNERLASDIYDMTVRLPKISSEAGCGQFAELYTDNGTELLPRPISICEIKGDCLRFVFRRVGKGTEYFSKFKTGDSLRVLGPCGNGFNIAKKQKYLLVGGGIGIPPLLETAKQLSEFGKVEAFLGFSGGSFLTEDFEAAGAKVYIATDDGSAGFKGNVVELMESLNAEGDIIYSCGPKIMLKFLAQYGESKGIDTYVSMEERMACGIGACVGCAVRIKNENGYENKKVCKDGPVFNAKEVLWL